MSYKLKFQMDDDSRKKRQDDLRGYINDDIPVLKDWELYDSVNDTLKKDITYEEIRTFIAWFIDGPVFPVPSIAKKIVCLRRTKLFGFKCRKNKES